MKRIYDAPKDGQKSGACKIVSTIITLSSLVFISCNTAGPFIGGRGSLME